MDHEINCFLSLMPELLCCQPGLRSIWEKYYEEAHAVIFVVDASCPSSFEDSKSALGKWSFFIIFYVRCLPFVVNYYDQNMRITYASGNFKFIAARKGA